MERFKEQIIWADSAIAARLTEDQIEEIIERHVNDGQYEALVNMVEDAYAIMGVVAEDADHSTDYIPY